MIKIYGEGRTSASPKYLLSLVDSSVIQMTLEEENEKENIIIVLDKVRHEKATSYEAIGIDKKTISECSKRLYVKYPTHKDLMRELGFNEDEIVKELKEILPLGVDLPNSKIIVNFWKRQNKKEVTLEEWLMAERILFYIMLTKNVGMPVIKRREICIVILNSPQKVSPRKAIFIPRKEEPSFD